MGPHNAGAGWASRKDIVPEHQGPGFWPWLCASWQGELGQVPSLLGFPILTHKATGVGLEGDISCDPFRLENCEFVSGYLQA